MKVIGILGGMSNQATAEYYRLINERVNERLGGWDTAEVIINSVNFGNIERFVRQDQWDAAGRYLSAKAQGVEKAGAEGVILGCTEIFLLISQPDWPELPMFDTTTLHAHAAVDFALSENRT